MKGVVIMYVTWAVLSEHGSNLD